MTAGLLLLCEIVLIYTAGKRLLSDLVGIALRSGRPARTGVWLLLAPGVTLHETAHAVICLALGGRVEKFVPFSPKVQGADVQLGYVSAGGWRGGPLGGAMVGLAPLWMVPLLTVGLAVLMIDGFDAGSGPAGLADALSAGATNPLTWAWCYLALSASVGLLPSPTDHRDLPAALALAAVIAAVGLGAGVTVDLSALDGVAQTFSVLLAVPAAVAACGWMFLRHSRRVH